MQILNSTDKQCIVQSRFAPSPTGRMHAGNIFSALLTWLITKSQNGKIVLRIEDLDSQRSKQIYAEQLMKDFDYLGLYWDLGPYYQQDQKDVYEEAFQILRDKGLIYPCFCSRADLHSASAPHEGEKPIYPGSCKKLNASQRKQRSQKRRAAYRLEVPDKTYGFHDLLQGDYVQNLAMDCGDFIVKRSDGDFAYQLACVVDDADQGINCVVRGRDLLSSTPQQMYLQELLELPSVNYAHIPLLVGEKDRRLSKRDKDASLDELKERFKTPEAILGHIAYISGLIEREDSFSAEELLEEFDISSIKEKMGEKDQILWS